MKLRLATTLVLAVALVLATFAASTTITPPAKADPGPWNVKGCPPGDPALTPPCTNDNVVLKWDEQLLATIRANAPGTGPTVAARALGMLHTATYDAWEAYDPTARSTLPNGIPEPQPSSNVAAERPRRSASRPTGSLSDLFPFRRLVYDDAQMTALSYTPRTPRHRRPASATAAQAVIDFRHGDDSNQTRNDNGTPATPTTTPSPTRTPPAHPRPRPRATSRRGSGTSRPTPGTGSRCASGPPLASPPARTRASRADRPASTNPPYYALQQPLTPQWPKVKTFAASPLQYKVTGPPKKPDGTCYSNADVATALNDASNLDDNKKVTAEYWADGPGSEFPPGHMAVFAQALSRKKGHSLDTDVKMFFALGNALLDASVGSWTTKYKYDFWRPITAIRHVYAGPDDPLVARPGSGRQEWTPYQAPHRGDAGVPGVRVGSQHVQRGREHHPERFTTSDIFDAYVDIPDELVEDPAGRPSIAREIAWPTFTAAADQAGISRRYGGIHFWSGDYHARMLGNLLGRGANAKAQSYIQGKIGS